MHFKAHFQEAYLDREKLEQIAGAIVYGSAKNFKHSEMEVAFINVTSATSEQDVALIEMRTININLTTQLRQKEDHIRALQAEMSNLKVVAAAQTTEVVGTGKGGGQAYTHGKNS